MGYILKNNNWTPKPIKKTGKNSVLKEKTPLGSHSRQRSARKYLIHDFEGNKREMGVFIAQVMELLVKLNKRQTLLPLDCFFWNEK